MDLISEYTGGKSNKGSKGSKGSKGDKSKHKTHYKKKTLFTI